MSSDTPQNTRPESGPVEFPSGSVQKELVLERINCPLCGSQHTDILLHAVDSLCGVPGRFAVETCRECQHMFMNPRPAIDSMPDCYPPRYGPHQVTPETQRTGNAASEQSRVESIPMLVPWYLRYLPIRHVPGLRRCYYWLTDDRSQPLPDSRLPHTVGWAVESRRRTSEDHAQPRALELGCATGRYLQRLMQDGWAAVGVEPGERPAAHAQAAGLNVQCGTLTSCHFQQCSFDAAAAWMVIEHVPDPRQTLTALAQLLKPQGQLLISVPNAGCWEPAVFGQFWYAWEPPRHLHHFTPASIRRLLSECGFTEIIIVHQRSMLSMVGSLGIVILSRWPRSRLGSWLKSYPDQPGLLMQLLLAPAAHLMAFLRQSSRLTITATARRETH